MKKLIEERWGKLTYHKTENRLHIQLSNATPGQFKRIINRTIEAAEEYHADSCLADIQNRVGSTSATMQYAVQRFKLAMKKSLKKMAIILPKTSRDKEMAHEFVSNMGSFSIRTFSDKEQAKHWLDGTITYRKAA